MDKVTISGIELSLDIKGEILRMGGPWIGDIYIGNDLISKDCVIDNFVYQKDTNCLYFVKYHLFEQGKWIFKKSTWHFTINFYNTVTKTVYEFIFPFNMVHLGKFLGKNELEIYNAFHGKSGSRRGVFKLDEQDFHIVSK